MTVDEKMHTLGKSGIYQLVHERYPKIIAGNYSHFSGNSASSIKKQHPDAMYHRKLQTKLYHLTCKSRIDINPISFLATNNAHLQICVFDSIHVMCKVKVISE
jgi:hypothetical protein